MFWCLGDEQADENGVLLGYTKEDINNYIGIENFCESLPECWIGVDGDDVKLPNYQSHNGITGKKRAQDQKRQKNSRNTFDIPVESERDKKATREEKRREENIKQDLKEKKRKEKKVTIKNNIFNYSSPDFKTAQWIFAKIKTLNKKQKKPDFEKWANSIQLMREENRATDAEIRSLFEWASNDEFWKCTILSPDKLRQQWDNLTIKSKRGNEHEEHRKFSNSAIDQVKSAIAARDKKELDEQLIGEEDNTIEH